MNDFKRIVINNIESELPYYLIEKNKLMLQENKPDAIIEEFKVELGKKKRQRVEATEVEKWQGYEPDVQLGKLGEKYIEDLLLSQMSDSKKVLSIERISETRRNYFPGYDIEVKQSDNILIGIEVKSTRISSGNIIHMTNNEIRSAKQNCDYYYLIIVVFNKSSDIVKQVYKIKNPIKVFELEEINLETLVETKGLGKIEFYPQQFTLKIEKNLLNNYLLCENEQIL